MKNSKEYIISFGLFGVALILFCTALVMGVVGGIDTSIEKICCYLGFSFLCFGYVFLDSSKETSDSKDECIL